MMGGVSLIITGISEEETAVAAFFYDLLYNGIFWVIVTICDMYLFLERFMVVNKKCPIWKKCALQAYIWMTILIWAPAYSILPFFCNINSVSFWNVYGELCVVSGYLVLVYNLYFTFEFAFALHISATKTAVATGESAAAQRIKAVAIKSIFHCINSSIWNIVSSYWLGIGNLLFVVFIPFGIHFLFNYKLERFFSKQRKLTGRSRPRKIWLRNHLMQS